MKKMKKVLSLFVTVLLLCTMLTACGISKEEAVGTWSGSYTYNGSLYSSAFILNEDGTYVKATIKDGSVSSTESGDYEIKGSKVILYDDSAATHHGISTEYKYKKGALVNNDHEFTKSN